MNDQQVQALKPLRNEAQRVNLSPSRSPAALQGATSAFFPKASTPTVSVSSASTGARLAAYTAGTLAQRQTLPKPPEHNGKNERSPPRGRQLHSQPRPASSIMKSAPAPSTTSRFSKPLLQPQLSSTLAAQYATTHSRSPQRSYSKSPHSSGSLVRSANGDGAHTVNTDALTGAASSMKAQESKDKSQTRPVVSVKSRIKSFEVPSFSADFGASQSSLEDEKDGRARARSTEELTGFIKNDSATPPTNLASEQSHVYIAARLQPPRPLLPRDMSSESAATAIAVPNTSQDNVRQLPHGERSRDRPHDLDGTLPLPRRSSQVKPKYHDDYKASMTVNELADAMVASSLASSRAASPSKKPAPPVPRKRSHSFPNLRFDNPANASERQKRSRKVPRPMKQTLRKPASSDDEVELIKRGRRHWMRKHPNMHSEGDRKRWRDRVTERERKRYEGVFAANRALFIGSGLFEPTPGALSDNTAEGNRVVNVVVRDIWERSRLPREVLKEVYDLVSPDQAHALNREQFVVGLWLIDQRLKGRKLPVRVSASVWASVRHSHGIKIKRRLL